MPGRMALPFHPQPREGTTVTAVTAVSSAGRTVTGHVAQTQGQTAPSEVGRTPKGSSATSPAPGHLPRTQINAGASTAGRTPPRPPRPGNPAPAASGLPPLTLVPGQGLQLLPDALVPAGNVHMQGVVAAGPAVRSLPPLLEGRQQAHARVRAHVVHCGGSAVSRAAQPGTGDPLGLPRGPVPCPQEVRKHI